MLPYSLQTTPVCLIAFKRPELTRIVLDSLSINFDIAGAPLYIYIDAPRSDEEAPLVEEVATLCSSYKWNGEKHITRNTTNGGLRSGVISAISNVLETHPQVCVVEDDIVTTPFFYKFMCTALHAYKDSTKVSAICGSINFFKKSDTNRNINVKPFFARHFSCWGWATWRHVWNNISWDDKDYFLTIKKTKRIREFNYGIQPPFYNFLSAVVAGKLDTWATSFGASSFLKEYYCYYPPHSLTLNIGWSKDMGASHPNKKDPNSLIDFRDFSDNIHTIPDAEIFEHPSIRQSMQQGMKKTHSFLFFLKECLRIPFRLIRKVRTLLTHNTP